MHQISGLLRTYTALRVRLLVLSVLLALPQYTSAQLTENKGVEDTTGTFWGRRNLITYGIVAHTVFTTYVEYQWWWKGDYHPFHLQVEGFLNDYSLGVDKIGHFYTSHFYFTTLHRLMVWGGYDESTSLWVSALIPSFYALSIEIGDGFSTYQFAPDDLTANLLGVGYGLLQVRHPFLRNFKIKWSFIPTSASSNSFKHPFSDDYDGHIYWLSMNVHDLLPESMQGYWPKFLSVALGYGGQNISKGSVGPPLRKFALSLDYNLIAIPLDGDSWDVVKSIVDLFHLPAPGVRFVDGETPEFKPLLLH